MCWPHHFLCWCCALPWACKATETVQGQNQECALPRSKVVCIQGYHAVKPQLEALSAKKISQHKMVVHRSRHAVIHLLFLFLFLQLSEAWAHSLRHNLSTAGAWQSPGYQQCSFSQLVTKVEHYSSAAGGLGRRTTLAKQSHMSEQSPEHPLLEGRNACHNTCWTRLVRTANTAVLHGKCASSCFLDMRYCSTADINPPSSLPSGGPCCCCRCQSWSCWSVVGIFCSSC